MAYVGWDEVNDAALLNPFENSMEDVINTAQSDRNYSLFSSFSASTASWRVEKPVYNSDICIHCQNCWTFCPDSAILSEDKKMQGIDYDHCKGCGVCADVCPTNPKSLIMYEEAVTEEVALSAWPEKKKKEKKAKDA